MKKMWKRFVSLLLACTLLAGMLPLSASAAGENRTEDEWKNSKYGQKLIEAGYNFAYGYELAGTDIIYASFSILDIVDQEVSFAYVFAVKEGGAPTSISNFQSGGAPWSNMLLGQVYIEDEVTGIGSNAFGSMPMLETVVFEDASTLNYIGQRAFYDDDNAVFTDEGNEGETTLDLSGVTTMGEYAFYNCDKLTGVELGGNITAVETVEGEVKETEHKIPNNAFNNSGLQTVTIPDGIVHIGDGAFGHTSLSAVGELVLPSGLQTIGDSAFVVTMGSGETGIGITSLTIPSSVKSIGENAFSGRRNLAEVTVEDDKQDGTKLELGNAAFGHNESSAFSEWGSITDAANITYTGNLGTEFHLPADIAQSGVFENGKTCYTGDISPMTYDTTLEPTCTTAGYHQYKTTISGAITENGEPVEVQYRVPLGALGHKWGEIKEVGASCERDGYFYQDCVRTDCEARTSTIEGSTGLFNTETGSALTPEEMEDYTPDEAEGHIYQPDRIEAPILAAGQKTVLYYVCKNPKHDDERDSTTKDYPFTLQGKTLSATTTDTLNDLTSQLAGFSSSGIVSWDVEENQLSQEFGEEGTKYVNVKFTPKNAGVFTDNVFSEDSSGTHLQITIQVKKAVVDLSGFSFSQNAVSIDQLESATVTASGFGGDAKQDGPIEFYNPADDTWTSEMPTEIGGDYKVRVPFSYETSKFRLPTDSEDEYPQDGSKIVTENGKNYLVHDFAIIIQSINATVRAKQNLVYDGTEKTTVSVSSLRENCHVAFYLWENDDWVQKGTYTSTKAGDSTEGISLKNAGTYKVKVEITLDQFETQTEELEVTIAKAPVQKPRAKENLQYLPRETQQGFESLGGEDERYIITGGTGVDAKTYTATATLNDSANYCWQGENASTAAVQIPWTILPQRLTKPNANSARDYSYQYGQYREPLTTTAGNNYAVDRNEGTGLKGVYYIGNQENEGYEKEYAYTVTNSWMTDAKEYTSVVHLNDNKNYVWHDGSSDDVTIHWEIRKATLELPNVTVKTEAKNVPYDGEAYEEANIIVAEKTLPGDVVADAAYEYAKNAQFSGATENAPTDAGDYFVRRNYTYNADNYAVVGGIPSASFTINKATAQMTFTEGEVTATYTAQGTDLQQVTVDGLVDADKDNPASEVYNVTYTYKYRTDSSTTWEEVNTETKIEEPNSFKFTDVGEYQITATFSSNNYTATPAIYTLTIEKANAQKITLTSAGTNKGQWNEENKTYTTTYGAEASFTITGTAALDAENAAISYEVTNDGANVVSVDSGSGMVTIKQAGEATITVTAAETANVGAASVEYTVTVKKAKPTVSLTDKKLEVPYTGQPIEGYDKATATAEVVAGADQPAGDITYTFYTNKDCTEKLDNGAEGNVPIAVGTYYMKATYPGDTNYEPAESEPVTVTVTKAQLTVDAEGYTGTYNGETYPPITVNSVTGKDSNLSYEVYYMKDDGTDVPAAENEGWSKERKVKDVADSGKYWYKVVITGEHANDYAPYIASAQVTISAKVLQLTGVLDEYTKTYDGNADITDNFNITVTTGTSDEITVSSATGTYANKNAGKDKDVTLILTLSGTDIKWGNYSYNGTELTKGEITLTQAGAGTITPKAITVTGISAENRVYDGTKVVQLTGTPETTDKVGEDNLTLALASNATGSIESADVGNDKAVTVETSVITLGGDDANNYKVSAVKDAANGDVKVNITQRPVNLEFAGIGQDGRIIEKAYTGQPVSVTVGPVTNPDEGTGFVDSDQLKADDVDYTYTPVDPTTDKNHTTVGSYTVTAKLKKNPSGNYGNYELKFPAEATLEITPAEMVVIAEDYTGTYTGKDHNVTASWTAKTTGSASTEIEITTVEFIKKEDDTRPEAGAEGWDEISFINVAQSGEYWYKVTAENYAPIVGDSAVTITINPATLTLSSSLTKEKGYDGTTVAVVTGQKVTGAQNGENITVPSVSAAYDNANVGTGKTITITYTLSTEANLGNYKYNDKALAADTQTVSETVSDCSITQAPVTVTISDQTSVYDGKTVTPIQTEWKVSDTDLFDVDNDGIKDDLGITLTVVNAKNAGKYAITGTANNSNYAVTFAGSWAGEGENKDHAGTYTIDPRPINVEIGDAEGFYGDAPDLTLETKVILTPETAQGENAGLVEGENIYDALEGLSLGSYATVSSPVDDNYTIYPLNNGVVDQDKKGVYGNYDVTFTQEGTYTVKQRPITITIKDHSSVYGEKIDGGIATPLSGTDYTVAITEGNTVTTDGAIVNGDDLGITLFTTAQKSSDAGAYSISGKVTNTDLAKNYAITWKGQTPYQENEEQATYTVKKATLAVEFTNEEVTVSMGGTVNNPLKFINQSNSDEELGGQPQDVTVKYSSNDQGVATVNETTGEITLVGTGNATITAEVTSGGKNFTEGAKDSYIIHVAEDGGLLVTVTPKTLTYTGEMQNLISYSTAPAGAEVTFKVEAQTEGDRCQIASDDGLPQGQDAGTYRVSWVAKLQGYRDATGSTTVTIAKASPTTGFSKETVSVPYEENGTFDSTEETTLNVADDYKGTITYMSNDTRVASVQGNSLENISLNGTGSATITAVFTETDNYTAATASFRITVGTAETTISYTAEDYSVEYDRIAHGSKITVKSPSEYTIMYSDNNGTSYDLNESPTITDAGDLTIYFQIQADGYNSASGTQKVTVEPKEITANMVTGIAESYTYTGKEITFDDAISVHDEGVLLEKDKDYTITYDDNKEVGQGSVTITGRGNYKGSVTKNFTISPVDASDLTASLNRTFGYYGDSYTNNATVTVTHGSHTVTSDGSNTVSIAVKDNTGTDVTNQSDVVSINDHQTVTFNQVGTYTIEVTVTGNHETNAPIQLTYALLPVEEGKLVLKADNETSVVETYGDTVNGTITVTDVNGTPMTENTDYTLAYTYTPFEGTAQGSKPYDPSVMSGTPAAGMYVVTATGQGGYANSVGTFTFLILQRDLAKATLAVNDTDLVFNHDEKKPDVTVTVDGNAQPTEDADYTVTYYNNVNASKEAKAVVTAKGNNFTGSNTENFSIAPKEITDEMVKEIPEQYYTGNAVIPPVTITDGNYTLILGYDYTTACDAIGPGTATVTIEGKGNYTETTTKDFVIKSEGAPEPSERFDLVVTPSQWIWKDDLTNLRLSVTFGTGNELTLGKEYTLEVNGQTFDGTTGKTKDDALTYIKGLKPGEYTITATGVDAYKDSEDTETVTVKKIQPELTVTAAPGTLSGGGKVTLTLKGENLPDFAEGQDLSNLLAATAKDAKNNPDLSELEWETDEQTGVMTAELTLPNTNETYTFTLTFIETATHAGATDSEQVVVAQQIISGGGGGGPVEDQPANPDDTGVSDWLNTKDHLAYLAGYPGGTFGPDQNMTRAEAAQMFYNLLLEKDVEITVEFEDVPADAWYAKPVNTLASLGILSGVGNGRFDPDRSITRAEFTVIAMKFANTSGGGVNIFSDVNEDDWFYSAVVDSTQYGWINGYPDGTFRPEATISRAEVTVIVNHMLGRAADRPYVIAHEEELNTFGDVNRGHWGYFHVAEATNAHEYHTEDGTESWTGLS